jgi:hypothetical protein
MRPCAAGEATAFHLCDLCDFALNRFVLRFFLVPGRRKLLADYKKRLAI